MGRPWIGGVFAISSLCGWLAVGAFAHPGSGIVVNANGEVFFVYKGVWKIARDGKLTHLHQDGGGHWLALDTKGKFASVDDNRLFKKLTTCGAKPALLYASGGAPFIVHRDGNLYYGSGFPEGADTDPGFHTVTRLSPDGKRTLFAPQLKTKLAQLKEGVTGLTAGPDGTLLIACPNAILRVKTDGTVKTFLHPVKVKDRDYDLAKNSHTRAYHSPYLRGLDVTGEGTIYAAVTGCRCVVKITPDGKVETVLKAKKPWTPTGVAVRGKGVLVLEYPTAPTPKDWVPRVRELRSDGKVAILADLTRDENKRKP